MQHPFLFFTKADADVFRERMTHDEALKKKYQETVKNYAVCLNEELITEEQANGRNTQSQHADFGSVNGQAGRLCTVLGAKYVIEGDTECAEKLKQVLLHYIKFERWFGVSYTVRFPIPWHADLCSTGISLSLARIFDLIYGYLSEEERKIIAKGILEKGVYTALGDWVLPESRIHAIDSMGHNWWAVCIGEAATAFLALSDFVEPAERDRVIGHVNNALADYLKYSGNVLYNKFANFDDRGMFYESAGYNNFGTGNLLSYLWCSERLFGRNETVRAALPENLCDGMMEFSYPYNKDGKTFYEFLTFGDHSPGKTVDLLAKYCVLTGIASEAMKSCAATYNTDIWDELIGYEPSKSVHNPGYLPKESVFSSGYAVVRSSWENDATLFAVKSGYCWNHSHNDSGSFMIFHKGKPLFIDDGTCVYDSPLYHAYYCQDSAHSVLKIGGEGRRDEELYRGTKFPGKITDFYKSEGMCFIQADSTGPMSHLCSRMYRNFLWLDNRILVIFDDVYCHEENTVQFTLHFNGEYTAKGERINFEYEGISSALISHKPENMLLTEKNGHADHMQDEDKPYIELSTAEKARTHLLIHTLELDSNVSDTAYTLLSGENADGIRITDGDIERDIWFNRLADGHVMHDNSNNVIGGYDTDAYMLVITKDRLQRSEKVTAVCGSYLRRDGRVYITSFSKKTSEAVTVI